MKEVLLFMFLFVFVSFGCSESSIDKEVKGKPVAKKNESTQTVSFNTIEWNEAIHLQQKEGALYLDVRTPSEVAEGSVRGAINIPVQELEHRYAEIPKDKKILVYCRSGRRSAVASSMLIQLGYKEVYNIGGGFLAAPAGL